VRAVFRGAAVEDPEDAALAVAWARHLLRRRTRWWLLLDAAAVALLVLIALQRSGVPWVLVILWAALIVGARLARRRTARRAAEAERANLELVGGDQGGETPAV
jgi:hypothetical protein